MTFHTRDRAFSCDECPESIDVETSDFSAGLEIAKAAGWRRYKGPDNEWADACPVCVAKFAKRKRR
jgi:hypothetical protein